MERAPEERAAFVSNACGGDEALGNDVLRLLAARGRMPGFLESTALETVDSVDLAGHRLGPYVVLREIGRGGMCQVYLARDTRLDRSVAVKIFPGTAGQHFEREAHATASLNHPHICSIYDVGREGGLNYLVIEHLDGETLKERLKRGPLAPAAVVRYAAQIADALKSAHAKGIVHRDIKPANIMITSGNEIKVLDFGLAERLHPERPDALTYPGLIVGTVEYMSPEQAMGRRVDARTDIFALGVVLYEMVTARLPFAGKDVAETVERILHAAAPEMTGAPARLQRIVRRCLEKNPGRRYQSGAELQVDLAELGGQDHFHLPNMLRLAAGKVVAVGALLTIATSILLIPNRPGDTKAIREGYGTSGGPPRPEPEGLYSSIAVLPFADMSPQRDQEYFCDGLTEGVMSSIAHLDGLHVAARTSVFEFKGKALDMRRIGAQLKVRTVLEGSVRRTGERLRITAQLVSVSDGRHLWSQTYDLDMKDVVAIQEEVARAVMGAMKAGLRDSSKPPRRHTPDVAAHNLYLLGRYYFAKRPGEAHLTEAIGYFEQALQKEPDFALAHAGLADCYTQLALWDHRPPREVMPKAQAHSVRALQIDDTLAEGHVSRAMVRMLYEYQPNEALRELEQATQLNPGYAVAHWAHAVYLQAAGQSERAMRELSKAQELDPLSIGIGSDMARFLFERDDQDRAMELFTRILDMEPSSLRAQLSLGEVLQRARRYPEAIAILEKAHAVSPNYPRAAGMLGLAYGAAGRSQDARQTLDRLIAMRKRRYVPAYDLAIIYMGLGETDRAFEWLDKSREERHGWLMLWARSHLFDNLRSDQRFGVLMKQMGWETP